ncbi:hypothetical protein CAPTEDRAFT_225119 [Capitella teleta]|uniref:Transcription initiation factor IIF subunit alpha n=1 Tax=Capitella teleta TaxID=283909 RepID=R7U0Q6_CAPTE|nr:hypothetical protein CAPTEDRAFT_225119 [Capitella teleta]|eukprot:ELT96775.1 hypothetical protein CAPTEDRAFT_225119 [Capitella teleta]
MASNSGQEFTVRIARNQNKKHSILKFNESNNVDFTKCGSAKLERENNLKEFKTAHDIDVMPKYGAGSEFGRDQREETRKRKYGIMTKRYKPEDQPWLLKLGSGKQSRRFKGTKEGTVADNARYYIFTQCSDGAFEASPVDSWYNFAPIIKYKYLNSEEAEEEFTRRDRTLNYFSVMVKKRLKNDPDEPDEAEAKAKVFKKKKGKKDFMLTEMDEWADISDDDDDDDNSDNPEKSDDDAPKKKKDKGGKKKKGKIEGKKNSDDEAVEESDSFDEGAEVDYMTSSDSDDDLMYSKDKDREDSNKYSEKGVEDEDGLRKLMSSDEEEEEQEKPKTGEEEEEADGEPAENKEADKSKDSDTSSSSSSESDSDPEKDSNFASAFFLEKKKKKSAPQRRPSNESEGSKSMPGSRSATPTKGSTEAPPKAAKKKTETEGPLVKKPRLEQSSSTASISSTASLSSSGNEGVTEETVRRYLMRKPMTAVELLQKFKSKNTGMSKQAMVTTIANIVKKLNPEKTKVKDKMYLFIKKKE